MNEGDIRIRGLEAIRDWVSKDDRYISMIGECEIIRNAVSILRRRTIGEGEEEEGKEGEEAKEGEKEEEEEGVSVREKNGLLGIVLEVVEGGAWKEEYEQLEEVVGQLEEEGKKRWMEKRGKKGGRGGGREWKEMGRLAHEIGWAIEEKKNVEGGKGIVTLGRMKKDLMEAIAKEKKRADEAMGKKEESERAKGAKEREAIEQRNKREEAERGRDEEKKRADEEQRKREETEKAKDEEKKRADEEKRGREEEKRKKEEAERRAREEKRRMEKKIEDLERLVGELKLRPIISMDALSVTFSPNNDGIRREGNAIIHHGIDSYRNCFIGEVMTSV